MELNIKKAALNIAQEGYKLETEKIAVMYHCPCPYTFEEWLDTAITDHRFLPETKKNRSGRAFLYIARNYLAELNEELSKAITELEAEGYKIF